MGNKLTPEGRAFINFRDCEFREVFDRLAAADHISYLSGLGDEVIHDWGRVHGCFHEFVLIDRSAGRRRPTTG